MLALAPILGCAGAGSGDLDPSFIGSVTNYPVVDAISVLPDGYILAAGNFTLADNWPMSRLARFNADGSIDTSFNPGTIDSAVDCLAVEPDGHCFIGGHFQRINGTNRYAIARLDSLGNLDSAFNPGHAVNNDVYSIAVQTNGAVIIGGFFSAVGQSNIAGIARLTPAGQLDTTFNIGSGTYGVVYSVALQPDAKILIAGNFSLVNGTARHYVARLNSDGTLDTAFDAGLPLGGSIDGVYAMALQPDGRILLGGLFDANGGSVSNLARLNPDGSLDPAFTPAACPNGRVYALTLLSDGRIIISGYFGMVGNATQIGLARLNSDGTLDPAFKSISAWWGTIQEYPGALATQADNKVLVGGSFDTVQGIPHGGIARLLGDPPPRFTSITRTGGGSHLVGSAATNAHLQLDGSSDLLNWAPLLQFTNTAGVFSFDDSSATNSLRRFYRAVWLP